AGAKSPLVGGRRSPPPTCPAGLSGLAFVVSWPLPEARSDRDLVVRLREQVSVRVHVDGKLSKGPAGRAEHRSRVVGDLELRLVARAQQAVGLLLVQAGRAAGVAADLRVGDEVTPLRADVHRPGV